MTVPRASMPEVRAVDKEPVRAERRPSNRSAKAAASARCESAWNKDPVFGVIPESAKRLLAIKKRPENGQSAVKPNIARVALGLGH
jgi:hypothetical protein